VLMQRTRTLLVDEPISPLDHSGKSEFLELFRSLAQQGITTVLTMHDIHYPSVPFVTPMYESLTHDSRIEIHGHAEHHHENFAVELLSGPHIVLHVNFRFHHEHAVVINSSVHGRWGPEVRTHNPVHKGEHFHLEIKVHHGHYVLHVNGHHLADFHHRYPIESVQALGITGHVNVKKIEFHGFPFAHRWGHDSHDWGHGGYSGYGTHEYVAPVFHSEHEHHRHFL